MTTAQQVLDVARSQLGTVAGAGQRNPYGKAYGMDGVSWCNQFTWWCFGRAGGATLTPKSAYTPTTFNWYKAKGLTGSTPRPGALVFYNWPGDGVNRIQHIGFVEAVNSDGTITTIEGNTSSGSSGSQGNGGGVHRRRRATTAVVGYAYPTYAGAAPAPAQPSGDQITLDTQAAVHVGVDGVWGPVTDNRVHLVRAAAQGHFPEGIDIVQKAVGVVGPDVWGPKSKAGLTATILRLQRAWGVDYASGPGVWGPRTEARWNEIRNARYRP